VVYLLATACALSNALASVLQRMGVEDALASDTLKLGLLTHALKRGVWLLGFAFVVATVPLQIVALHLGSLSQVQPILTAELLFLVILLATWFRFQVGWREWFGCAGAAGGLAGFLIFAQPGGGSDVPTTFEWVVAGSLCGGTALLATLSAFRGPRWWRAAAFGVAGAVGFAFTASLIKTVSNYIVNDWVHMFFHWQTFGAAVCGALSLCVTQNALHAGPIAASQTALVLVDPLVSIALGIGLYGDNLRTAGAYGPLEAISLLIMFVGAASIALSPLVSGMKGEDDRYAEMLSLRSHSKRLINAVQGDLSPK
jgi:hypothetical protein